MAGTLKKIAGPAYIAAAAADIYAPPAATIYTVIRHIHIANRGAAACSFCLYVGATGGSAAGTELYKDVNIPIAGYFDAYMTLKLTSADFLSGVASLASHCVITVEGEQNVV